MTTMDADERRPIAGEEWSSWRPFVVESRVEESAIITSFLLRPVDGRELPPHRPGQHLTLLLEIEGQPPLTRNYSVSSAPNGRSYRISVKREPLGTASPWLHESAVPGTVLKVMPPSGQFTLPENPKRPIVLLSGGVGATPMVSMIEAIAERHPELPVQYVHGTSDGSTHAFGNHVRNLAAGRSNIEVTTFYSRPRNTDVAGRDFDIAGRITPEWLRANTPVASADYFICGPLPLLRTFTAELAEAGVPSDRIHYEFFGPVEDLLEVEPSANKSSAAPPPLAPRNNYRPVEGVTIQPDDIGLAILASASDAVIASDREGLIVLWNPGAERIFGFTEAEAMGQSLDIIIPEPFRARHWDGYRQTVASGQSRYGAGDLLAVPGLRKDGQRNSIEFTIVLLKDAAGEVKAMASVVRDVTKRFDEMKALRKQVGAAGKPAA